MKNNLLAGVALVGVILLGVVVLKAPAPQTEQPPQNLGGAFAPDLPSPYFGFGGVREWAASTGFYTGSTTLCAIQSPAATTTIVSATVRIDTSTTSASMVEIGRAATAFATTTRLALFSSPTNGTNLNVVATTTATALTDGIVPPLSWINTMIGFTTGTASAATVPTGKCSVVFREI